MGNLLNKFCGTNGQDDIDDFYIEPPRTRSRRLATSYGPSDMPVHCEGWVWVLRYDKETIKKIQEQEERLAQEKEQQIRESNKTNNLSQSIELNVVTTTVLNEEFVYIKHRNKLLELQEKGTRYYAVLDADRLNLYNSEETANRLEETWKDLPEEQYVIFRQSQTGLVEEDSL